MWRVVLFKERAALGKFIDVGRCLAVIAVATHVVCAQAINAKQNEVCFFGGHSSLTKEVCVQIQRGMVKRQI